MRFLLIACLFGLVCWTPVHAFETTINPDTAALVNGTVITTAEYRIERSRLLRLRKQKESDLEQITLSMLGREALENLIGRELLYQESAKKGLRVPAASVEAEVAMLRGKYSSAEEFTFSLEKMALTEQALSRQIEQGMAIQRLIEAEFGAKTQVSESEARAHYDSHRKDFLQPVRIRLSHILAAVEPAADDLSKEKARKKIAAIRQRITGGESFSALAGESDDASSNKKGGDLGYYSPGQLGKSMEEAAFSLKAGQLSAVVEDRFGYHLLKVTERKAETPLPFETVKDGISKQIQRERTSALMTPFLKRLRESAKVEILLGSED
ncbi:MAG: peptidylprolyl isomerase [Desulfuromonadales bacterium]|nr:peptidylprolyl isomerase [Desulfuromonadales bacterium]